ncbi:hypothetical protein BD770DRAFT_452897 [Pilaira anomala]|nr:hypothetical protein BD770DRAFT_452897 [Pilaira anomala]
MQQLPRARNNAVYDCQLGQQPREGGNTSGPKNITACKVLMDAIKPMIRSNGSAHASILFQTYDYVPRSIYPQPTNGTLFCIVKQVEDKNHSTNETYNQDIPLLLLIIRTEYQQAKNSDYRTGRTGQGSLLPSRLSRSPTCMIPAYLLHYRALALHSMRLLRLPQNGGHMPRLLKTFDQRKSST